MTPRGDNGAKLRAGAPLMIRRADQAVLGGLLLIIAGLWLAAAAYGILSRNATTIPGLGSSGAYIAGALGAALAVIALTWMVRGRIVVIGRGMVAVTVWSLLGRHTWHEPLANYGAIRIEHEQRRHRYGGRSWYVVRLCHTEPGKALQLARAKDLALIERRARDYAKHCGLPLSGHRHGAPRTHGVERAHPIAAASPPGREPISVG